MPKPDLVTAAEAWLIAGGPHHTGLTQRIRRRARWRISRRSPGLELLVIDDRTRTSEFKKELRWNQAYYRLARGL